MEVIIDNVEPALVNLLIPWLFVGATLLTSVLRLDSTLESHLISFGKSLNWRVTRFTTRHVVVVVVGGGGTEQRGIKPGRGCVQLILSDSWEINRLKIAK